MSLGPPRWSDLHLSDKVILAIFMSGPIYMAVGALKEFLP